jgi:cell division protein FtsB
MTKAIAQTYTTVNDNRTFIVRALLVGCVLVMAWYGINIYDAVSRTIASEQISAEADALSNSVNQLNAQYIKLADNASPSALASYGMSQSSVSTYIPRTASLGIALSAHEL